MVNKGAQPFERLKYHGFSRLETYPKLIGKTIENTSDKASQDNENQALHYNLFRVYKNQF